MIQVYHLTDGPYVFVVDEDSPAYHDGPTPTDARPIFAVDNAVLLRLEADFGDIINDRGLWESVRRVLTADPPRWMPTQAGVAALQSIDREESRFVLRSPWHPGTLQLSAPELCALFHSRLAHNHP